MGVMKLVNRLYPKKSHCEKGFSLIISVGNSSAVNGYSTFVVLLGIKFVVFFYYQCLARMQTVYLASKYFKLPLQELLHQSLRSHCVLVEVFDELKRFHS